MTKTYETNTKPPPTPHNRTKPTGPLEKGETVKRAPALIDILLRFPHYVGEAAAR